jgi:uncharacterized membrane protein (UPF0127 family)
VIENITKNSILAEKFSFKKSFGKIKGLLGKTKPETLVFTTRFGIHTFFLQFPIDLIVLDSKRVVRLAKTVKPNRVVLWNIKFKTVIELPFKTLGKTHTKIGDIITF